MLRFFSCQSATLAFTEALALLFAISWLDLATGHQVSLVLFYTAPIVLAVWLCDNKSVFVIAGQMGIKLRQGLVGSSDEEADGSRREQVAAGVVSDAGETAKELRAAVADR